MSITRGMERIKKAKVKLILEQCFFGTLSARLSNEFSNDIETAQTDGKVITWNPTFLARLSDDEVMGVLAHEILHVANGHTWRRDNRTPGRWNAACDFSINPIL